MHTTALKILQQLRDAGHQAYWVGGCVRDLLMGQSPKDYDIATNARPEQVMTLFPRTIPVGAKFGVILVPEEGHSIEVSTFRSDGIYDDGRHPNLVVYSDDPREDVLRRDFTINGMLFDPIEEKILDFVGGQSDLQNKIIRAIGQPRQRFREDKLRLMRAVRFAARLQFQIEKETRLALEEQAGQVVKVSPERIRDELLRILCEGYASRGLHLLEETGLLGYLLPEVAAMRGIPQPPEFHPEGDVWQHTLLLLDYMDRTMREGHPKVTDSPQPYPGITLAMGALLHDIGKPRTFQQLDRARFNRHAEVGAGWHRYMFAAPLFQSGKGKNCCAGTTPLKIHRLAPDEAFHAEAIYPDARVRGTSGTAPPGLSFKPRQPGHMASSARDVELHTA